MNERLQKIISSCGVASRRNAEKLILAGDVMVNGKTAVLGEQADIEKDDIVVCGKKLVLPQNHTYVLLNKPRGYVTTMSDEKGRKTVRDLVEDVGVRIYPVGRLDINSEGLLILTDDGELANILMHPSSEKVKEYYVWVEGNLENIETRLSASMEIDGYKIRPAEVRLLNVENSGGKLSISIHEGRNRQIRKMCEKEGLRVSKLVRVAVCGIPIGALKSGKWRYLTADEVSALKYRGNK